MKALASAFVKAQKAVKAALKDSENEGFKRGGKASRYADLTSVWEACRSALAENGFGVLQPTNFDGENFWLETILLHESGEQIVGRYPIRPSQSTPQAVGSAITYARRYSLAAMVGVVADEDDDGNAASAPRHETIRQVDPPPSTMTSRKNEAAGQRTASQYKADCIAALAKIKTSAELTAWSDAERDTLEKLEKASRDAHTAIMDKVAEAMDRVSPKRGAAE